MSTDILTYHELKEAERRSYELSVARLKLETGHIELFFKFAWAFEAFHGEVAASDYNQTTMYDHIKAIYKHIEEMKALIEEEQECNFTEDWNNENENNI